MRYYNKIVLLLIILFVSLQFCYAEEDVTKDTVKKDAVKKDAVTKDAINKDASTKIDDSSVYEETEKDFRYYTVKKNDTISEIAWTLKVKMQDLMKWNPDISIREIQNGQQIRYKLPKDILMTTLMEGRATRDTINNAFKRMTDLMRRQKTSTNPEEIAELDTEIARLKGLVGQDDSEESLAVISKQLDHINKNIHKISPPSGISDMVISLFISAFLILFIMSLLILRKITTQAYKTHIAPISSDENQKMPLKKIEIKTDLPIHLFNHSVKIDSNVEKIGVDVSEDGTKSLDKAIKLFKKKQT
jgi:pentapeptide MXKDX repeat protein